MHELDWIFVGIVILILKLWQQDGRLERILELLSEADGVREMLANQAAIREWDEEDYKRVTVRLCPHDRPCHRCGRTILAGRDYMRWSRSIPGRAEHCKCPPPRTLLERIRRALARQSASNPTTE